METLRRKYRILMIMIIIILGLIIGFFFTLAIARTRDIYRSEAEALMIQSKKSFLKDTIDNVIIEIDNKRASAFEYYENLSTSTSLVLHGYNSSDQDVFIKNLNELFGLEIYQDIYQAIAYEQSTQEVVYSNYNFAAAGSLNQAISQLQDSSTGFSADLYGGIRVIFGAQTRAIDERVQAEIRERIHSMRFDNDVYVWVNEVLDYDGGDDYAIRRIHPNLKDSEGSYLSTKMTDLAGNQPYLAELEGIKKDGELFQTYFFKKLNSDTVSEKLSYASLYEPYNWIVATGIHLDDIKDYIDNTTVNANTLTRDILVGLIALVLLMTLLSLASTALLEQWYYVRASGEISSAVYSDELTGALNRRSANKHLTTYWRLFNAQQPSPAFILCDIDDFKIVNDTYGHNSGDLVLKQLTETIRGTMRSNDRIYRWGGEEFLIVCQGMLPENAPFFVMKLLSAVAGKEMSTDDGNKVSITLSAGISYFDNKLDTSVEDVIKRADIALYHAKKNGKNQVCVQNGDSFDCFVDNSNCDINVKRDQDI